MNFTLLLIYYRLKTLFPRKWTYHLWILHIVEWTLRRASYTIIANYPHEKEKKRKTHNLATHCVSIVTLCISQTCTVHLKCTKKHSIGEDVCTGDSFIKIEEKISRRTCAILNRRSLCFANTRIYYTYIRYKRRNPCTNVLLGTREHSKFKIELSSVCWLSLREDHFANVSPLMEMCVKMSAPRARRRKTTVCVSVRVCVWVCGCVGVYACIYNVQKLIYIYTGGECILRINIINNLVVPRAYAGKIVAPRNPLYICIRAWTSLMILGCQIGHFGILR